jgi:hypothetical protein
MPEPNLGLVVARHVEEMKRAGGQPTGEALGALALEIARAFKARRQEVAILRLSADGKMISFVFPLRLAKIGAIPLTTLHSLAAKTIREKKGEVVNNFPCYRHPTVFESVKLSEEEKAAPIQKIVSAPMIVEGKIAGAIEVSRKGKASDELGPDFTARDLVELQIVGTILGKFLMTLPPASQAGQKPARPGPPDPPRSRQS